MQKKKLLLLSAIVLLMGTNSYGTLYPDQDNQTDPKKDEIITQEMIEGHLKGNTIVSVTDGKYTIISDNVNVDVTNSDKTVDKKIININSGSNQNLISENNGILKGTNNGGKNFSIVNIESGNFKNNGTIEINGTIGKGINLSKENGKAENNGTIKVNNGASGVVISQNNSFFVNNSSGEIYVDGEKSKGIEVTGQTDTANEYAAINKGYIEVSQKFGTSAVGIQVTKGKALNEGIIKVNAGKYTSGMKAAGASAKVENIGIIDIQGNGQTSNGIIAENGGKAINDKIEDKRGTIKASGKNTSAMYSKGNGSLVENRGEIELSNSAAGIKLESNGVGKNSGTIKGSGIGVNLIGGIFVNSGEISIGDIAIQSSTTSKKENNQTVIVPTNNTVYLKNGSKINGKIVGNTGIDVLALEGNKDGKNGKYSNLNVENYEALVVRDGDVTVNNSNISLNYNNGIGGYLKEAKEKLNNEVGEATSGNLTMNDSKLVINFGDKLKIGEALENPIIDVGENGTLTFGGKTSFIFNSKDRDEYNVNEILGVDNIKFEEGMKLDSTIIWDYTFDENGNLIAKKDKYNNIITNSYISDFASALDKARPSFGSPEVDPDNKFFENVIVELESLKNAEEFTKGLAQISGGIHGYTVDIAAINSRNLVNTMKNKALTRDYLTARPLNSWYQDVIYLDNNQRLGGLMSGSYQENGILGISEKQSVKNGRLGFVYGGSKGKAKFDGGDSGEIATDNIYVGLYYNHNLSEKLALNTNFSFVYGHNNINRRVNIGNFSEELKSHYPTYAMGVGTSAIYTIKDDAKNKASFYAGIDVNRIMQGNINEKEEERIHSTNQDNINLMVKNQNANEFSYYSITPHAGFMFQNTGYIFDRKYLVGADLAWETELGNIKDGKRLNMQGITDQYKVGTMERENVFSTSIFGQLDITESLALNGRYTSSISDEYDADMLTMGLTYKMDTMADTPIFGPLLSGIENTRLSSDRWSGTFALMMESEDDSDRVYYSQIDNSLSSGDYATSMKMKPKFTLSLNDKKTKWSYYFEGYYMANDFLKDTKAGEAEQKATRLHGEARWSDSYSKGRYGFNIGYRNETSDKPALSYTKGPARVERGVHQLRLTPNFSYNLGSGFRLDMKTTGIFEYNYTGLLEGQMDFLMENEHNLVYTGFMPRWQLRMGYYREDRWMDHDGIKYSSYNANSGEYVFAKGAGRYQMNQLRPSATYYFGNGDSITFALRVPLGNGAWYNSLDNNKKDSESYETRYTVNYNHVVVPGFNIFGELTFLDLKTKVTKENDRKVTRAYSFRPTVGFSYNF